MTKHNFLKFAKESPRYGLSRALLAVSAFWLASPAFAQEQGAAQQEPAREAEATHQEAVAAAVTKKPYSQLAQEFNFKYYYSPDAGLKRSGGKVGDVRIERYGYDYKVRYSAEGFTLLGGVHGNYMGLDADDTVALPGRLQAIGLILGAGKDLKEVLGSGWSTFAMLRPTMTSSETDFSGAGFVLQGLWTVNYQQSKDLVWTAGVAFTTHANNNILPVAMLKWNISEDWSASIGYPEANVAYRLTEEATVRALVGFMQGSYRVNKAPAPIDGGTYVDYREVRLGGGLDYAFSKYFSISLDAGAVVDRRFDYYNRDYNLKGRTAAYVSAGLQVSF